MLFVITYHLVEARKIAMLCLSVVCRPMPVSVCLSASLSHKPHVQTLPNFLCTLLVAVTRPTSGSVSIRNVLPVSWSTSCLLITIRHIGDVKMAILEVTHQWAAPNEKSDVCNHPLASHTDTIFFETYFQMSVVTWSSAPLGHFDVSLRCEQADITKLIDCRIALSANVINKANGLSSVSTCQVTHVTYNTTILLNFISKKSYAIKYAYRLITDRPVLNWPKL